MIDLNTIERGDSFAPKDSTGPVYAFDAIHDDRVQLYPAGGGFVCSLPVQVFCKEFEPYTPPGPIQGFAGFEDEKPLPCVHWAEYWNGWAVPYFTYENLEKLSKQWGRELGEDCEGVYWLPHPDSGDDEVEYMTTATVDGVKYFHPSGYCFDYSHD